MGEIEPWANSKRKKNPHLCSVNVVSEGTLPAGKNPWHVTFSESDSKALQDDENDSIVITTRIGNIDVKRILLDDEAVVEILSWEDFKAMHLDEKYLRATKPVFGFANQPIAVKRQITFQ